MGEVKLEIRLYVPNSKVVMFTENTQKKKTMAMCPISSNISTSTEKLAAWLVDEMRKYPVKHGKIHCSGEQFERHRDAKG